MKSLVKPNRLKFYVFKPVGTVHALLLSCLVFMVYLFFFHHRVCKRWGRVTKDNKFWRHVDLRPYKLDIGKMWKIIRKHFSHVLLTLRMRGYMDRGKYRVTRY